LVVAVGWDAGDYRSNVTSQLCCIHGVARYTAAVCLEDGVKKMFWWCWQRCTVTTPTRCHRQGFRVYRLDLFSDPQSEVRRFGGIAAVCHYDYEFLQREI
jgi:hypothetical protein